MVKEKKEPTIEEYRVFKVIRRGIEDPSCMVLISLGKVNLPRDKRRAILYELKDESVDLSRPYNFPADTVINPIVDEETGITFPGFSPQGDFKDFFVTRLKRSNRILKMRLTPASMEQTCPNSGSNKPKLPLNSINNFSKHPSEGNSIGKAG